MVKSYRRRAAILAVVVLTAFIRVIIYASFQHVGLGGHQWGAMYLFVHALLQELLIGWCFMVIQLRAGLIKKVIGKHVFKRL